MLLVGWLVSSLSALSLVWVSIKYQQHQRVPLVRYVNTIFNVCMTKWCKLQILHNSVNISTATGLKITHKNLFSVATCIKSMFQKVRLLCQPTSDWGPANRQNLNPLTTYESVRNTIVLVNGLPVIQESHADSESLEDKRLWEWACGRSSDLQESEVPLPAVPVPQVQQKPGPSILKNPGGGTKSTKEESHIQQVIRQCLTQMSLQDLFKQWRKFNKFSVMKCRKRNKLIRNVSV